MLALRYLLKGPYEALKSPAARQLLRLMWHYGNRPRYQTTTVTFGKYRLQVPDSFSFIWQFQEIFGDEFYKFNCNNAQPVIYDCGANVGMSVLYLKELYPQARIKAFEAEPKIAELLVKNLQQNNITDVEIVAKAVWIDDAGVEFGSEAADSSSIYSTAAKRLVPSLRLRDHLAQETRIDFLKIDIEGAEIAVVPDCRDVLHKVQHLFIEFHAYLNQPQSLKTIVEVLEENSFRYYIDTNQHRTAPFVNRRYRGNEVMDLQLNIFAWRP